jgi:cysteine desulfurase
VQAAAQRTSLYERARRWRDRLLDGLAGVVPGVVVTAARRAGAGRGHLAPGWAHLCVSGVRSEPLLFLLEHDHGVCASAASACASGAQQRSHVLEAMGVPGDLAAGAVRLTLGWSSTDGDVAAVLAGLPVAVARLRAAATDGVPV